jgi:CubicO group peptidase (beta-lactamase class C family)
MNYLKFFVLAYLLSLTTACSVVKKITDMPIGIGFSALELCSRIFISEEDEQLVIDKVLAAKVFPLTHFWNFNVNRIEKIVSVSALFFSSFNESTAIYRSGIGCTLAINKSPKQIKQQTITPLKIIQENTLSGLQATRGKTSEREGLNRQASKEIENIVASMFLENLEQDGYHDVNTFAALVAYDGEIVTEQYEENHNPNMRMLSWSMAKTITGLLAGILYDQGKLDPNERVAALSNHGKTATIAHVMNMSSGLDWQEGYKGASNVSNMLYMESNSSEYVALRDQVAEAGSVYQYSTGDTQLLAQVISSKISPNLQDVYEFYQRNLFHKLGIYNAVIEHDESGNFLGGARIFLTPRDWLKIGLLISNKGLWKIGEQGAEVRVVSQEWIEFMSTASPAVDYYGGQIWLNDMEANFPDIPRDALFLRGHSGQFVGIVPSKKLVMVRLGVYGPKVLPSEYARLFMEDMIKVLKQLP